MFITIHNCWGAQIFLCLRQNADEWRSLGLIKTFRKCGQAYNKIYEVAEMQPKAKKNKNLFAFSQKGFRL